MLNAIFEPFSYSNCEVFCKQSVLLVKDAPSDILHLSIGSACDGSHTEVCRLVEMDRLIPRGNKHKHENNSWTEIP